MPDKNSLHGFYYCPRFISIIYSTSLSANKKFLYLILVNSILNSMNEDIKNKVEYSFYTGKRQEDILKSLKLFVLF